MAELSGFEAFIKIAIFLYPEYREFFEDWLEGRKRTIEEAKELGLEFDNRISALKYSHND